MIYKIYKSAETALFLITKRQHVVLDVTFAPLSVCGCLWNTTLRSVEHLSDLFSPLISVPQIDLGVCVCVFPSRATPTVSLTGRWVDLSQSRQMAVLRIRHEKTTFGSR